MTGASGAPDKRPGREPASASFETVRVPTRRGSPPIFILGFLVVIGGLIAVSVGSRGSAGATSAPVALGSPVATSSRSVVPTPTPVASPVRSVEPAVATTGPGDIELLARRSSASIFVHGDVFVPMVTWVFVSLQDDRGDVAGWASVSVPGAAGAGSIGGPTLRFDVELAVPATFSGPLWITGNAYDAGGHLVTSTRLEVAP
jgi:hypothetical protein